jgi:dipeptidase
MRYCSFDFSRCFFRYWWIAFAIVLASAICPQIAEACTGVYVGSDASDDGSTLIARSEDISAHHNKMFQVISASDCGFSGYVVDPLGHIMQSSAQTLRYTMIHDDPAEEGGSGPFDFPEVGMNEANLFVSATISTTPSEAINRVDPLVKGGLAEQTMEAVILKQARSAREGIALIGSIVEGKGAAEGNILFLSDPDEHWMMEIVSGHQWVAVKLPDNVVGVLPNVIVTDAPCAYDDYYYSKGLADIADAAGTAMYDGKGHDGSHLLVGRSYAPGFEIKQQDGSVSGSNIYRIWGGSALLNQEWHALIDSQLNNPLHFELPHDRVFYEPDHPITLKDVMKIESLRYEGTPYDANNPANVRDDGSYRYRPIGIETQTEIHIAQVRQGFPKELTTLQWQAFGNGEMPIFLPFYTNLIMDTDESMRVEGTTYNERSFYWQFSRALDLAKTNRTQYMPAIKTFWAGFQDQLIDRQVLVDQSMQKILQDHPERLNEVATTISCTLSHQVFKLEHQIVMELEDHIRDNPGQPFVLSSAVTSATPDYGIVTEALE